MELLEQANVDAQAPDAGGWKTKPLGELIAHIVAKHHGYVRQETPRIQALLTKVWQSTDRRIPRSVRSTSCFRRFAQELSTHMLKEEQVLFPYIERMEAAVLSWRAGATWHSSEQ